MSGQYRMGYVWVLLVVVATFMGTPGNASAAVIVNFPDANFETEVRIELGLPAPSDITDSDMARMTSLNAHWRDIANIQGIEYATNLTYLGIGYNQISDISPVSGLKKLTELALTDNQISDISSVSGLTKLTELILSWNQISDILALSGLTNLTELYLWNNQVSDISPLSGMNHLTKLVLAGNQISDISALSGLANLVELHLQGNQIETLDLRGSNLSSLELFTIKNNPIRKVVLADSTLIQAVFNALMYNGRTCYDGIAEMPGVLSLDLSGVDFKETPDLSAIYGMDDLETLLFAGATNLDGSQVTQLTDNLDSLAWLDVTGLWESFSAGPKACSTPGTPSTATPSLPPSPNRPRSSCSRRLLGSCSYDENDAVRAVFVSTVTAPGSA